MLSRNVFFWKNWFKHFLTKFWPCGESQKKFSLSACFSPYSITPDGLYESSNYNFTLGSLSMINRMQFKEYFYISMWWELITEKVSFIIKYIVSKYNWGLVVADCLGKLPEQTEDRDSILASRSHSTRTSYTVIVYFRKSSM